MLPVSVLTAVSSRSEATEFESTLTSKLHSLQSASNNTLVSQPLPLSPSPISENQSPLLFPSGSESEPSELELDTVWSSERLLSDSPSPLTKKAALSSESSSTVALAEPPFLGESCFVSFTGLGHLFLK